jgi:hypothetical protein
MSSNLSRAYDKFAGSMTMIQKLVMSLAALSIFWSSASYANDDISYGIGTGALTSGLGVNAALRSDSHMGYIAAGCLGIGKSDQQGWILPCGIGAGWIQTDLLSNANNHHGLGVYVGPVGKNENNRARYGVGVTYVYFLQGVSAKGWNLGVTPATGQQNGKAKGSLLINVGYQF